MGNEWSSNVWIVLELLIVSVVMWYVTDSLWVKYKIYTEPDGFNIDNVYKVRVEAIKENSPDFKSGDANDVKNVGDLLKQRFTQNPYVESVAFLSTGVNPYRSGWSTGGFYAVNNGDTISPIESTIVSRASVSPEIATVLGYEGARGETSQEIAEILRRNEAVVSENVVNGLNIDPYSLIGYNVVSPTYIIDGERHGGVLTRIGGVIKSPREGQFTPSRNDAMLLFPGEFDGLWSGLAVKVKDGMGAEFEEEVYSNIESKYRVENHYVSELISYDRLRDEFQRKDMLIVRNLVTCMLFLAVSVFLGLLGSFWFRTQQRFGEIAIRKVNGAKPSDIFRRLISEGLLLLVMVTPVALVIDYMIARSELTDALYDEYFGMGRLAVCAALTFLSLAAMMVLGIWLPARKAMKLDASEVLKNE